MDTRHDEYVKLIPIEAVVPITKGVYDVVATKKNVMRF